MADTTVVNCRREPYDVYIGRGSIFGNPFSHLPLKQTTASFHVATRSESIQCYKDWLDGKDLTYRFPKLSEVFWQLRRRKILASSPLLAGKRLGCYCKPKSCHGDILVALANQPEVVHG